MIEAVRQLLHSLLGVRACKKAGGNSRRQPPENEAVRAYNSARRRYLSELLEQRLSKKTRVMACGLSFEAHFDPEKQAVWTSSLGAEPYLPTDVFVVVCELLSGEGVARLGDAMKGALGDPALPLDSVEGAVAEQVFGRQPGERVYRRVGAITALMVHLGMARLDADAGVLETTGAGVYVGSGKPIERLEMLHSSA
ncbi:MAG: hypothetical protein R2748_12665 [Bryobacterales bacterium]